MTAHISADRIQEQLDQLTKGLAELRQRVEKLEGAQGEHPAATSMAEDDPAYTEHYPA